MLLDGACNHKRHRGHRALTTEGIIRTIVEQMTRRDGAPYTIVNSELYEGYYGVGPSPDMEAEFKDWNRALTAMTSVIEISDGASIDSERNLEAWCFLLAQIAFFDGAYLLALTQQHDAVDAFEDEGPAQKRPRAPTGGHGGAGT